jgi:hypothetical protein
MIAQPRQEGDHTKLPPFVMMNADVVGLCYTASSAKTLENAVNEVRSILSRYSTRLTSLPVASFHQVPHT